MLNGFGIAIEKSFEGTVSTIIGIIFVIFILLVIFLWVSVPFILLSIKKELKSLNKRLEEKKEERLD